jgi:Domain of unknown function (DUF4838)
MVDEVLTSILNTSKQVQTGRAVNRLIQNHLPCTQLSPLGLFLYGFVALLWGCAIPATFEGMVPSSFPAAKSHPNAGGGVTHVAVAASPNATIVKPAQATARENFAASELQRYIEKISGATLPIALDYQAVDGNRILIGGPERNAQTAALMSESEFDASVPGPEGMMIRTLNADTLVLAGSSKNPDEYERGTIYAVYEFLERYLGCSFAAIGKPGVDMGEYVPRMETISLSALDYTKHKADALYRGVHMGYTNFDNTPVNTSHGLNPAYFDWLMKNRFNLVYLWAKVYRDFKANGTYDEIVKRGMIFNYGGTSGFEFLPPDGSSDFPEPYYSTHPKYYSQANGAYHNPGGDPLQPDRMVLNYRNPDAITQVARNIKQFLAANSSIKLVQWYDYPYEGEANFASRDAVSSRYTMKENYVYGVNEIAKQVNADHPNVRIELFLYGNLMDRPESVTSLDTGLLLEQANRERNVGKSDGTGFIGTSWDSNLYDWINATGRDAIIYDHVQANYGSMWHYIPSADELQAIFQSYAANGNKIIGAHTGANVQNHWNYLLDFYTYGRTLYDYSLSFEDNLDRFARIFGDGGPYVKSYLRYVEGLVEGQWSIVDAGQNWIFDADMGTIYGFFENAYNAATTASARNNLRLLRMVIRYTELSNYGTGADERYYMWENFDSGTSGNTGYGIGIPDNGSPGPFQPDRWYTIE